MANYPRPDPGSRHNAGSHTRSGVKEEQAKKRQKEADIRQAKWEAMSPTSQLADLDRRLGKNKGAVKQRARIQKRQLAEYAAAMAGKTDPVKKAKKGAKKAA